MRSAAGACKRMPARPGSSDGGGAAQAPSPRASSATPDQRSAATAALFGAAGDQAIVGIVEAHPGLEPVLPGLQPVTLAGDEVVVVQGQAAIAAVAGLGADIAWVDVEAVANRQLMGAGGEAEIGPGPGRAIQFQGQQTVVGGALQVDPGALGIGAVQQGASR